MRFFKNIITITIYFLIIIFAAFTNSCQQKNNENGEAKNPIKVNKAGLLWLDNAVIYEINLRQFSSSANGI